jgi:glycosyltransferase involved in cell wall biosynthesis
VASAEKVRAMKLSIVIPVYNEINTLEEILGRVENANMQGLEREIILVDDASVDGSGNLLRKLAEQKPYKVYFHEKNQGKGAAIRTAVGHATGDIVIIQDADLEYDPNDYESLLKLIVEDKADVVYGSRFLNRNTSHSFSITHYLGNIFLTFVTNVLFGSTITDMETCYKAFRAGIIKSITIKSNRFDFEPEITAKILKQKVRFCEVPISYQGRAFDAGKKITWKDGIGALIALAKYRFVD